MSGPFLFPERSEYALRYLHAIAVFERTGLPYAAESAHFWFIAYCYGKATAVKELMS